MLHPVEKLLAFMKCILSGQERTEAEVQTDSY
jgi:hypothetical protein